MAEFLGGVFGHITVALVGGWAGFIVTANLLWITIGPWKTKFGGQLTVSCVVDGRQTNFAGPTG